MEFKKSKYPKVIEAYLYVIGLPDQLIDQEIVNNESQERIFLNKHTQKEKIIKERRLNSKEINHLPFFKRIMYIIPTWALWLIGVIVTILLALILELGKKLFGF